MGTVGAVSPQANVVRGIREMVANSVTFRRHCNVNTVTAARDYTHVVVQTVENNSAFRRPAAIVETPQTCSYRTERCGVPQGVCRVWLVKDVPDEYREDDADAWFDFANFADGVAQDMIIMMDPHRPATFSGQIQGSEISLVGQYTRATEDTEGDYYLACYAVSYGLR